MKAVRIYEYGGPEVLRYETDVPEPEVRPDAVLLETVATSVNPIDWKIRSGAAQKNFPLKLPAILGRDVSGVVRSVGSDVRGFKPGDHVIALADATYAQFVAVPGAQAIHLPNGLDPTDAAALPLVVLTGEQLVRLATQVQAGQTVLVTGALGSVGRAAVYAAKKAGARVIAGVRKAEVAEADTLGVHLIVALDDDDAVAKLETIDGVADTVGGETAAKLLGRVRAGGRFGYTAILPDGAAAQHPEVEVCRVLARPDAAKLREFAEDARVGRFVLPISQRLLLSDVAAAHERLEKGGGGKIVLTV